MELQEIHQRVCDEVTALEGELIRTVQEVVRIPSVVGNELKAQDYIEELYRSFDLEVTRFQADIEKVSAHPGFIDTGMSYENRPNIIGTLPGDPHEPSLILNGHIDVVSPEPVDAWSYDPWGGEVVGDKLYGRGAGDMKAGLVANFFALKALRRAGLKPKGTVMLQSVIDEEAGGTGGTLSCLEQGYRADGFIASEPHSLQIVISHVGVNYFRVRVLGKTSHAGLAHLGVNAIGKMYPVYQALIELDEKRGREIHFPIFERGSGRSCHLNIGTMKAGDWPSTVAGSAEIECRIGFVPGETMADIKRLVEETVQEAARKDPWLMEHPPEIRWFGWQTEAWYQDPDDPFPQALRRAGERVLGDAPEFIGRAGGNDARFAMYYDTMAGACTGPLATNIHGIDEYVDIPSAIRVAQVLAMTVLEWCGYEA